MTLSVVLASCRSAELAAQAVASLLPQCREANAELIVARSAPAGRRDPGGMLDGCRVVQCPDGATVPEIRGAGLAAAAGDWILLTEDNCVARGDWLNRLSSRFGTEVEVVGGTMGNAHPGRPVDAGAFFAEYGFYGPSRAAPQVGVPPMVTGANVGYRRSVVGEVAEWASAGQWESVIHERLAARGARFALVTDAVVKQNLHYRLGPFCRDRFEHTYRYAKVRCEGWGIAKRLAMATASPLLPLLLTWRVWRSAGRANRDGFLRALPFTLTFFTAWAAGEAVGYLHGQRP